MIRRSNSPAAGAPLMAVFAAGLVSGALLVLTVQSRPAPAVPAEPAPSLSPPPIARATPAATHPAEVLRGARPCLAGPRHQDPAARHRCARTQGEVCGGADDGRGRPRRLGRDAR